jgi:hypothetical protein
MSLARATEMKTGILNATPEGVSADANNFPLVQEGTDFEEVLKTCLVQNGAEREQKSG